MEALSAKQLALMINMFEMLQPVQKREAGVAANVLLSLIDWMKLDAPLMILYSQIEQESDY